MPYIVYINGRKRSVNNQKMLDYYRKQQERNPLACKVIAPKKNMTMPAYKTHTTLETYIAVIVVFLIFLAILAILASLIIN